MTEKEQVSLQDGIALLVGKYGKEEVTAAAEKLLACQAKQVPTDYIKVLAPDQIHATVSQLDAAVEDLDNAGRKSQESYGERGELLRQKAQLETAIELTEAEALMGVKGTGKNQYVEWNGEKVELTNDKLRDAYRRAMSAENRKKLAEVEGDLQALEVEKFKAKDNWEMTKEAVDAVKAKAHVQAGLLNFLK
jgi:hypothetical protein